MLNSSHDQRLDRLRGALKLCQPGALFCPTDQRDQSAVRFVTLDRLDVFGTGSGKRYF